jgi:hypothetical protein
MIIIKLLIAALIGMFVLLLEKNKAMGKKSTDGNMIYPGFGEFIKTDIHAILGGILAIVLVFLFFGEAIYSTRFVDPNEKFVLPVVNWEVPRHFIWDALLVLAFSTIGYFGIAIPVRVWGRMNKLINYGLKLKTPEPEQEAPTPVPTQLPKP